VVLQSRSGQLLPELSSFCVSLDGVVICYVTDVEYVALLIRSEFPVNVH